MGCCCGLSDLVFPATSPHRLVQGTLLLLVGGLLWLVFEQIDRREHYDERQEAKQAGLVHDVTNKTAIVIAAIVFYSSIIALVLHILCIRIIRRYEQQHQQQQQQQLHRTSSAQQQDHRDDKEGRTLWEWFFYPEHETVPAAQRQRQQKQIRRLQTTYHHLVWSSHGRMYLLGPAVALFILLLTRLFWGRDDFQGQVYFIDFGWKYGLLPTSNSNDSTAERNVAFTKTWQNYMHAVQGFVSALTAFPVISTTLLRMLPDVPLWHALVHLAPYALTTYPTYSFIKRITTASSAFAGSSFANNGLEWAAGFVVALALGNLITSFTIYHRLHSMSTSSSSSSANGDTDVENHDDDDAYVDNQDQYPPWWKVWHEDGKDRPGAFVRMLQTILGLLFWATTLTTALMMGLSWHACLDGSTDVCINARQDVTQ